MNLVLNIHVRKFSGAARTEKKHKKLGDFFSVDTSHNKWFYTKRNEDEGKFILFLFMRKKYFNEIAVALGRAIRRYKRLRVFYGSEQGSDSAGCGFGSRKLNFFKQKILFSQKKILTVCRKSRNFYCLSDPCIWSVNENFLQIDFYGREMGRKIYFCTFPSPRND